MSGADVFDGLPWMERAACVGLPPVWWQPPMRRLAPENRQAVSVCRRCPVLAQCREWNDEIEGERPAEYLSGIYAGETVTARVDRRHHVAAPAGHCAGCGRPMRRPEDPHLPGTVLYGDAGECAPCRKAARPKKPRHKAKRQPRAAGRRSRPERCASCHRPLRSSKQSAATAPGTVAYGGRGLCVSCRQRIRRRAPRDGPRPATRPSSCVGCGRPMRDAHARVADAPGTVVFKGLGLCATCHERARRRGELPSKRLRDPHPTACVCCGRPMRSGHQTIKDAPGTVRHVGRGLCQSCWDREKRKARGKSHVR
jgi:hypothetical protein